MVTPLEDVYTLACLKSKQSSKYCHLPNRHKEDRAVLCLSCFEKVFQFLIAMSHKIIVVQG